MRLRDGALCRKKSREKKNENKESIKLFILEKKKKVPSNTFTERETQEKEETTQRQSVKTCDMKIVVHAQKKNTNNTHGRDT